MRRIRSDIVIIGNGGVAVFVANRLSSQGTRVVLINPEASFEFDDLRPSNPLALWNAAYRMEGNTSLSDLYNQLAGRMREVFPATLDQSGLVKREHWTVLSSTPIHRDATGEAEKDFFRIERKAWSSGQFRLVNPEHVAARTKMLGADLSRVAQIDGAIVRNYALWWDAAQMGFSLSQFVKNKFSQRPEEGQQQAFVGARIEGRYGRRLVILTREGEEVSVEAERGVFILLTGQLLPAIRSIVETCDETWIQGIRKRHREQHFIWFRRADGGYAMNDPFWLELGKTRYHLDSRESSATWLSEKGPDGSEVVVDEGLRFYSTHKTPARFFRATRAFRLEWEWKNPQWRKTSHETYWATSFEGDLWNIMELLWNIPSL